MELKNGEGFEIISIFKLHSEDSEGKFFAVAMTNKIFVMPDCHPKLQNHVRHMSENEF